MLTLLLVLSVLGNQFLPIICGEPTDPAASANPAYIQAHSSEDQLGSGDVRYDSPPDGSNDIDIENGTNIAIQRHGGYFGLFAAQIGSPHRNGEGEVHVWQKIDGVDVPNSNSIQSVERGSSSVLVFPTLFDADAGQNLSFGFSATPTSECGTLGLIASEAAGEPEIPSVIVSVIQLFPANRNVPAAFLSSSVSQFQTSGTSAVGLLDTKTIAAQVGASKAGTRGYVTLTKRGTYFVIASAQVGAAADSGASGEVHQWLKKNGADVPNSNAIQTITNGSTAVLITQGLVTSDGNDQVQVQFSSTDAQVGLIASTPEGEPAAPSLIFAVFRVSDPVTDNPHAQLSSSESQWGCLAPTAVTLDTTDDAEGITNSEGAITFEEAGTYFVIAAVQVGSEDGAGVGDVHLWMTLDGVPVPNSNALQSVVGDTSVLVIQAALVIDEGQTLELYFSTDVSEGTLGLVATAPEGEPAVPSVIFTAFKSLAIDASTPN